MASFKPPAGSKKIPAADSAYWPRVGADSPSHPIAGPFNRVPKHVATHRPDTLDWQNSHALEGAPADAVRALKRQEGGYLLAHSTSTPGGVLITRYVRSGEVRSGRFGDVQ
jgi:hypothetical protein